MPLKPLMPLQTISLNIIADAAFRTKLLNWASQFNYCSYFRPQQTEHYPYEAFEEILAIGQIAVPLDEPYFDGLRHYFDSHPNQPLFGYMAYDLKNELEVLSSENPASIDWKPMQFFRPACLIKIHSDHITILSDQHEFYWNEIQRISTAENAVVNFQPNIKNFKIFTDKDSYLKTVASLKNHILEGDIYEINYCINFSAETENFNPIKAFELLCSSSPAPFAGILKMNNQYILSASPERFIKLSNRKIISQPIKGTARRSADPTVDEANKKALQNSEKERAENMMIVDLVRNDLAKSSVAGSVKVEEMFGIYSFKQVHQMISTITGLKKSDVKAVEVIKNAFPMGSMTGAPKIKAMELIEKYENTKRGVFAGAIGYFQDANTFDFNVLIRSIYYDASTEKLNYMVGSAITHDSNPEEEYQECILKAKAIENLLGINQ